MAIEPMRPANHPLQRALSAVGVILALLLGHPSRVNAGEPDGNKLVTVSILADTAAIEPARPFRLAVRLKVEPGWHIYWLNPGDSGVPTSIDWKLPAGFSAGPLQWPAPHAFDVPGGMVNYGYENEVLLFATVTPPATLDSHNMKFSAEVSWLVCTDEQCLPGGGGASVALAGGKAAPSDGYDVVERWAKTVPVPADHSPDVSRIDFGDGQTLAVSWATPVKDVQWFPLTTDQVTAAPAKITGDARQTVVHVVTNAADGKSLPQGSKSVLAYTNAKGERRGLLVDFPRAGGE
jgi:thiol:disulfide interchange protein DsbD